MATRWGTSSEPGIDPSRLWEFLTSETNDASWRGPWLRSGRRLSDGPVGVSRRSPTVGRLASIGLIVAVIIACVPATPVPSGAQIVHLAITPSSVTLQPSSVRAGDVYLQLDSPESAPFTFIASSDSPNATPGPLNPDQVAGVRSGNMFHTVTIGFNAGGCSSPQDAAARGTTGECGNVRKVTVSPGTYLIATGDPGVVGTPMSVLTVTP